MRRIGGGQVQGRSITEPGRDLPSVQGDDALALGVERRDHHGAVEMLVPGVAEDPELLEPGSNVLAFTSVLLREAIPKSAVREPKPERRDHLRVVETTRREIPQSLRALLQCRVVEVHDAHEQIVVGRVALEERRQLRRRGLLRRRGRRDVGARDERGVVPHEQLDGVPVADAVRLHHPFDAGAAAARAARPGVRLGDDRER